VRFELQANDTTKDVITLQLVAESRFDF